MTPSQLKERLAELISQSIDANKAELTDLFWRVVIGNMPADMKAEILDILFKVEETGMELEFQPAVGISLMPKIMRSSISDKIN